MPDHVAYEIYPKGSVFFRKFERVDDTKLEGSQNIFCRRRVGICNNGIHFDSHLL